MKSSNRFTLIFGICAIVLLVAAVVTALVSAGLSPEMLPEDTPQGVVQRFLIAFQERDYDAAYDCLNFDEKEFTREEWVSLYSYDNYSSDYAWRATIQDTELNADSVVVTVAVDRIDTGSIYGGGTYTRTIEFVLEDIDGIWYITGNPPLLYFMW